MKVKYEKKSNIYLSHIAGNCKKILTHTVYTSCATYVALFKSGEENEGKTSNIKKWKWCYVCKTSEC